MELNKIYNEDCIETMTKMPQDFVDLIVTSPPYDDIRNYKGYSFNFHRIAILIHKVIKPGGIVVWVVGDQTKNADQTGTSFRQALYFKELGFKLNDTMIFSRPGRVFGNTRLYRNAFEYMFVFSKGMPKTINLITDIPNKSTRKKKTTIRESDGSMTVRKTFGKKGVNPYARRTNIWYYPCGHGHMTKDIYAHEHPAIMPENLAKDHILSWSNPGDLIYDPFMGSGTTAKMARILGRDYLGSEISKEYCDLTEKRLKDTHTFQENSLAEMFE